MMHAESGAESADPGGPFRLLTQDPVFERKRLSVDAMI